MTRKRLSPGREPTAGPATEAGTDSALPLAPLLSELREPLIERPDGWYWSSADGRVQVGPFASAEAARADLHAADEDAPEPAETLSEAEAELGIADWIDPDTGAPAEGQGVPRLGEE